jgi:hypothetical protein
MNLQQKRYVIGAVGAIIALVLVLFPGMPRLVASLHAK